MNAEEEVFLSGEAKEVRHSKSTSKSKRSLDYLLEQNDLILLFRSLGITCKLI